MYTNYVSNIEIRSTDGLSMVLNPLAEFRLVLTIDNMGVAYPQPIVFLLLLIIG
jgi:hypothetical protein